MIKLSHLLFTIFYPILIFGQSYNFNLFPKKGDKQSIDPENLRQWQSVWSPKISNDGSFISYVYYDKKLKTSIAVLQSVAKDQKREFPEALEIQFANDNRFAIVKGTNQLSIINLSNFNKEDIPNVKNFTTFENLKNEWIAWQSSDSTSDVNLRNLSTNKQYLFPGIASFNIALNGSTIALNSIIRNGSSVNYHIQLIQLQNDSIKSFSVWDGDRFPSFSINKNGTKLAFILQPDSRSQRGELWYYTVGMNSAEYIVGREKATKAKDLTIVGSPKFDYSEERIFISLKKNTENEVDMTGVPMDIWNYKDPSLQSRQLAIAPKKFFSAIVNVDSPKIYRLEYENENRFYIDPNDESDYLLVNELIGDPWESSWKADSRTNVYLLDKRNATKRLLRSSISNDQGWVGLSHYGKWAIYYDFDKMNYFSYETETGKIRNITGGIKTSWVDKGHDEVRTYITWVPWSQSWIDHDSRVLINDNFDIWVLDPSCANRPINLTKGFGAKNNISFRIAEDAHGLNEKHCDNGTQILLCAFDNRSKRNGFYWAELGSFREPEKAVLSDNLYFWKSYGVPPVKAKNANTYIVERMSVRESPNYFLTSNFKTFRKVTSITPEQEVNWITDTLLHFQTLDGRDREGILYRPENFNSKNRYPILFYFYERMSDELNLYRNPELFSGPINIPFLVSNGYLVFVPDIYYKIGYPGQSAFNCVVGSAEYLAKFPWADAGKFAIQGHSFGGYEVNYLVAHTSIFRAAISGSGVSDLISLYGSGYGYRFGYCMDWCENGQGRIGSPLLIRPDLYRINSPIFMAKNISTPLLIMANKNDEAVPFAQSVELFTALRRENKRVWLLQYDHGTHGLDEYEDKLDYTIRIFQFLNYCMNSGPLPIWMGSGVPAERKGRDWGLNMEKR